MIFDGAVFVSIIVSTVKCVSNYGKGFKEMILKQKQVDDSQNNDIRQYLTPRDL